MKILSMSIMMWCIKYICRKLGRGLRRFRGIFPINDMTTIYKTIIQRHIDHCITIWRYDPKCQIQRVERLKNKICRLIIRDYSWNTSPRDILSKCNIPSVSQRRDYFNCINVYRCLNGSFPIYMSDMLSYARILIHVLQAIPLIIISMFSGQGVKFIVSHFSIPVQ
jgi:hypothetical protein